MALRRVHVLYEHGQDDRPFGTAYLRLLHPLGHPSLAAAVRLTWSRQFTGQAADLVIVDRHWRPDATPALAEALIRRVRAAGARLVHALDDDLPAIGPRAGGPTADQQASLALLMAAADGLLVTTDFLAERLRTWNPRIAVVPNALDERLIPSTHRPPLRSPFATPPVVGYMGTFTHDADLVMVAEALQAAHRARPEGIVLEVVSGVRDTRVLAAFDPVPVHVLRLSAEDVAYRNFLLWFTHRRRWQLGLAPLGDTPFNLAKSDLKLLDYAAAGVAGVFSDVGPYRSSVRHLENGWRAPNTTAAWADAVTTLLADDGLRDRLAATAAAELRSERVLAARAQDWVVALDQLSQ